jgi:hypothetical protein
MRWRRTVTASKQPFRDSLNTSTVRGQKLGIVAEIELAAKAGDATGDSNESRDGDHERKWPSTRWMGVRDHPVKPIGLNERE